MKKTAFLLIAALALWGCATFSQNYKLGNQAEIGKRWDDAVRYYERASLENPKESVYRLALIRARGAASLFHLQQARSLAGKGEKEEALAEYRTALSYDPDNRQIAEEMRALTPEAQAKPPATMKELLEPPVKLKVPAEKVQLKFNEASLRSIFQAIGKHSRVNFIFDEQFRDIPLTIDLTDRTFEQALNFLCVASKNFFRVIDEGTVIIIPDQPMKRLQYELNAVKTFYLSNINAQDIQNSLAMMIRTQYKAPNLIVDKNLNSITIRDTPQSVLLADKLLRMWDKAKGEVLIDLEIMEVSRIKLRTLGIDLSSSSLGLSYTGGNASNDTGWFNLNEIDLGKTANYQVSIPTAYLDFLESDADTKMIAQPRLRGVGGEEIKYLVGQKVPVPQTTFQPFAAGGVSSQPIVNYQYQDVGIDVKIKPKIHYEKEITLELEIKITSISGAGIADIPIITTREVKNVIRLKDGETNLLAGLLKDEERKTLKGIAGLKNIPILGRLLSNEDTQLEQTDVVMTITPYIIRTTPLSEEDIKPLWIDVEGLSGAGGTGGRTVEDELINRERMAEQGAVQESPETEPSPSLIYLNPANFEVPKGREFRVTLDLRTEQGIASMTVNLGFNAQVLKLKDVVEGGLVRQMGEKAPFLKHIDASGGACTIGFSSPEVGRGLKGSGVLAVLVFEAAGPGEANIVISGITANAPTGQPVSFETNEARVFVR